MADLDEEENKGSPRMNEWRHFEFFLLRYVPDAVREEFVNFGLILSEKDAKDAGFADARFAKDWRRILCLDPQADTEALEGLEREIRSQLSVLKDRPVLLKWLEDSASNVVQVSPSKACLSMDPLQEIDLLEAHYLKGRENVAAAKPKEPSGRQYIYSCMRKAFEGAGVWKLLVKSVPVAQYTRAGDPFEFDMGYPLRNELKLFQAVSLKTTIDAAVLLAARYPAIAAGMRASRGVIPVLTAVVEDNLDRGQDEIGFALAIMEENHIKISPLAEMPTIAKVARLELRA